MVEPLLGTETKTLDKQSLQQLSTHLQTIQDWIERKPDVQVDHLTPESIQTYLNDPTYRETLEQLIKESHQTAFVLENLRELERLLALPGLYSAPGQQLRQLPASLQPGRTCSLRGRHA